MILICYFWSIEFHDKDLALQIDIDNVLIVFYRPDIQNFERKSSLLQMIEYDI
jgi:hypothetical protein